MNKIQITGAIMLATGKRVPEVAVEHGYTKHGFSKVINRQRRSPAIRKIISEITGFTVEELWPETAKEEKKCPSPGRTYGVCLAADSS